ncbi:glycosyltransferase family 2 protein [Alkalicoccobacillus murimartini]|uniref:Cellulose synthase/poly-beta-1,6-N-acetylglucosamine synthase-like glycosyltransferase n=1 Tax=Alkalicoccobacillus murimartini TaxID=171685 RepID=A0ABT9YFA4_9BACI|nr:glycosyltransferase family 2 protein [Alkalicoccobacillus murimartini]MDQ0205754.1 cellulose synthase/poly-beta-1,6-N-acetylglucosamine synthase-like glycosyltransferase [Alkalicoccobacillus murimartini]
MMIFVYVLITLLVCQFIWVGLNQHFMPKLHQRTSIQHAPLVSILIPLRNEEAHVEALIDNLAKLSYTNLEYVFLDDHSTDRTGELLKLHQKKVTTSRIVHGEPLPKDWVGKVFACHQLSKQANGEYLLFLDADVRLQPNTIDVALGLLHKQQAGLLSGFPRFPVKGLLASLLVPMQHVLIYLHLPLYLANYTRLPAASAAHGSFMLFDAEIYRSFGGHQAVKHSLVEDVHLTRAVKRSGARACLANITDFVSCFMYQSNQDVWRGFSKNAFPGIGRSYVLAAFVIVFYSLVFVLPLPFIWFAFSLHWLFALPLVLSVSIRLMIDRMSNQKKWIGFLMPFSALAFICILIRSMYLAITKTGFTWKGRSYS